MKVYVEDILAAPSEGLAESIARDLKGTQGITTIPWLTCLSLLFSDIVALCSVINIVMLVGMGTDLSLPDLKPLILSFFLFPLAYLSFGLYKSIALRPEREIASFTKANIAVLAGLCVPVFFIPDFELGMVLWLCLATPLLLTIVPLLRVLTRLLFSKATWWGQSTLVVADSSLGRDIIHLLHRHSEWGVNPTHLLQNTEGRFEDYLPLLEDQAVLEAITRHHGITSVVVALEPEAQSRFLAAQKKLGVFINVFTPSIDATGYIQLHDALDEKRSDATLLREDQWDEYRLSLKRFVDLLGAIAGLVFSAPLFLAISTTIKLTSRGPIFFKQDRVGKDGKVFQVLKFRTMHVNAEEKLNRMLEFDPVLKQEYEIFHKLRNDPRITPIGKFLRRYSLDELPQLWNVILGDMSLVGPRAYIPREVKHMRGYEGKVQACSPGITGLWQVSGRNQLSFEERVSIDVSYKHQWSISLDLYILLKTIPVVLTGDGAS